MLRTATQSASQRSAARARRIALFARPKVPSRIGSISSAARADAANLQCNLARVLGSSDFMNAIAAWTVLISEGNVCTGPAGFFLSLIVLNGRSVMAGQPATNPYHGMIHPVYIGRATKAPRRQENRKVSPPGARPYSGEGSISVVRS